MDVHQDLGLRTEFHRVLFALWEPSAPCMVFPDVQFVRCQCLPLKKERIPNPYVKVNREKTLNNYYSTFTKPQSLCDNGKIKITN